MSKYPLEDFLEVFNPDLQKLREQKGISQQDLAAKCNFEKSNMSRLEAGRVNPTLSTLDKVSNVLFVTLVELFNFKE
jgi:transcriptional regulator with XRE-family HTH domain